MKKVISLLLCLVLLLGTVPAHALAAEDSPAPQSEDTPLPTGEPTDPSALTVFINGKDVKEIEDDSIVWNEETNTLTLNNASILAENGTYKGSGIYVIGDDTMVLELVGDNVVEGKFNGYKEGEITLTPVDDIFTSAAISTVSGLIIRGDGTLTATDLEHDHEIAPRSAGIFAGGALSIEGGTIIARNTEAKGYYIPSSCIISGDFDSIGNLTISGGTVDAIGYSSGICCSGSSFISGGNVTAIGTTTGIVNYQFHNGINFSLPMLYMTGGILTTQGGENAIDGILINSSYKDVMWTDTPDGTMSYGSMPPISGYYANYIHVEPADLKLDSPTAQNQYTVTAQAESNGQWTGLPEDISAEYQWLQAHTAPVTENHIDSIGLEIESNASCDPETGLWSIPSINDRNSEEVYLAFSAKPGDIISVYFPEDSQGNLIIASLMTETIQFVLPGQTLNIQITENDFYPGTDMVILLAISEYDSQVSISLSTFEEIQTTSGDPSRFAGGTADIYRCRVTLTQNGTAKVVLYSDNFDYLPSNTVTFDAGAGTCEISSAKTQEGLHTLASLPEATAPEGYTFTGWFDAAGNLVTTDTILTEDTTVYAHYTINQYTVTWYTNMEAIVETYTYGETVVGFTPGTRYVDNEFLLGKFDFFSWIDRTSWSVMSLPFTMPAHDMYIGIIEEFTGWNKRPGFEDASYWQNNTILSNEWFCVNDKAELVTDGSGSTYYANSEGYIVYDITEIEGVPYAFDHETGVFLQDYTGIYEAKNGDLYYVENGIAAANKGLVKTVDDNGHIHYYYFGCGDEACAKGCDAYKAQRSITHWVENNNGYLVKWSYTFDENGVILHDEDTSKNGVHAEGDTKFYYMDGVKVYFGLFVGEDGEYYYATTDGSLVTNRDYWVSKHNGLTYNDEPIAEGSYTFDSEGRIVWPSAEKNGVYLEGGKLYYYADGMRNYAGLIRYSGKLYNEDGKAIGTYDNDIIYVRGTGELAVGRYWPTKNNGLMESASYQFDKSGKLMKLNGIVAEDGSLYYYVDGLRSYAGLIEIDGSFYYVRGTGEVVNNRTYWITQTNGLMNEGSFQFAADGKMIIPEPVAVKNGVYREDGKLMYYVDGKLNYAGLIQYTGDLVEEDGTVIKGVYQNAYIYVRGTGELVFGRSYWTTKNNDLMKAASYQFDENGIMTNPAV